jgi:hypothetical protein
MWREPKVSERNVVAAPAQLAGRKRVSLSRDRPVKRRQDAADLCEEC